MREDVIVKEMENRKEVQTSNIVSLENWNNFVAGDGLNHIIFPYLAHISTIIFPVARPSVLIHQASFALFQWVFGVKSPS